MLEHIRDYDYNEYSNIINFAVDENMQHVLNIKYKIVYHSNMFDTIQFHKHSYNPSMLFFGDGKILYGIDDGKKSNTQIHKFFQFTWNKKIENDPKYNSNNYITVHYGGKLYFLISIWTTLKSM